MKPTIFRYLKIFIATALAFCAFDALWLGVLSMRLYRREIGTLLLDKPVLSAAALFYVLFIIGIVFYAVQPARGRYRSAAMRGALFGFFTYMTYDLTNLATLQGWTATITAVDISWGCVVSALAAVAGCWASRIVTESDPN